MSRTITGTDYVTNGGTAVISETAVLSLPDLVHAGPSITVRVVPEVHDPKRLARLRKLATLSGDEDSLDWQLFSRVNVVAWGSDANEE